MSLLLTLTALTLAQPPLGQGDIQDAMQFVADAEDNPEWNEVPLNAADADGVLAMMAARDVTSDRPLESYDCFEDSMIDAKQVIRTRGEARWIDRYCKAARFARSSLRGYRTLGDTRLSRGKAQAILHRAADEAGVSFAMLDAIALYTSGYRPGAVSDRGAVGILQVPPERAAREARRTLLDPLENARIGARYLAQLLADEPTIERALTIYLGGRSALSPKGLPNNRETLWLVREVRRANKIGGEVVDDKQGAEDLAYVFNWMN